MANGFDTRSSLQISATASRELQNDVLSIFFVASESGAEPNAVQEALRKKVTEALAVVRPHLKDGEVEVETSGFSVSPRYGKKQQEITGYFGTTGLTVKGTDTATISGLASDITTMVVAGTGNSLSKKARTEVEKELVAEAIASFRVKASEAAAAFGHANWSVGSVNVGVNGGYPRSSGRMVSMSVASLEAGSATPMETEGGKTEVNATVQGSVILNTFN